ncbi:MAG TPA: hypothetical protein VFB65_19005, partial [Pyrinomonadaceae bacterium]|nr:hypothetical protein [Pyrinomonadaceae bacterium]
SPAVAASKNSSLIVSSRLPQKVNRLTAFARYRSRPTVSIYPKFEKTAKKLAIDAFRGIGTDLAK